jgi:hypothetical protein
MSLKTPFYSSEFCGSMRNLGHYMTSIPFGQIVLLRSQSDSKAFRVLVDLENIILKSCSFSSLFLRVHENSNANTFSTPIGSIFSSVKSELNRASSPLRTSHNIFPKSYTYSLFTHYFAGPRGVSVIT